MAAHPPCGDGPLQIVPRAPWIWLVSLEVEGAQIFLHLRVVHVPHEQELLDRDGPVAVHALEAEAELDLREVQVVRRVIVIHRDEVRHVASRTVQVDPRVDLAANATEARRRITVGPALVDGGCVGVGGGGVS